MIQFKGHIVSQSLDGQNSEFGMKKKIKEDTGAIIKVKTQNDSSANKFEDERNYFSNHKSFKDKANV